MDERQRQKQTKKLRQLSEVNKLSVLIGLSYKIAHSNQTYPFFIKSNVTLSPINTNGAHWEGLENPLLLNH